ncbi:iron complex transport system substrate-binding protein [Microlunatus sagamiharensis]|uniref:Iron complex transport system substrate-binding protein n=1 Tax=Microlunatus sagamiharensis TaxID=546874 RepID=A0A1H2LRI6_9ACTN|nr:iron-siderophore ABC transporter substrate-binding protein [Microlunatus sagamiharensis]SDU83539.1 iron complex transport system substrate-binding protein [Microlunatus sagamiharensis]
MSVEHTFGTATIPAKPQRVVVLGVTDVDTVLALGTTPVATTGYAFFPDRLGPWAEALVTGDKPEVLQSDSEPNLEQVAALAPDLIVGVSAGFDDGVYAQLSQIAPVVARPAGVAAYTASRNDATRLIAKAMGEVDRAEELIATADAAFDAAVEANPRFAGATATAVLPYQNQYGAYLSGDARGQVLDQLGFELPAEIAALDKGDSFFVPVSSERVDLLDGDVVVMLTDEASRAQVEGDKILAGLPVAKRGAIVQPDIDLRGAMTYNTVLSAPYAVEQLTPLLAEALGR